MDESKWVKAPSDFATYSEAYMVTMASFQFLENAIKNMIARRHMAIRLALPSDFDFEFSINQWDNLSLGQSIDVLKMFTKDKRLIGELKNITKTRNIIAHRAIVQHGLDGRLETPGDAIREFRAICDKVDDLLERLDLLDDPPEA